MISSSKSKLSNGRLFDQKVDGRSSTARRLRDLYLELSASTRGVAEDGMARRCAGLIALAEQHEVKIALGEAVDADEYVRITGLMRRLLIDLGLFGADPRLSPEPEGLAEYLGRKVDDDDDPDDDDDDTAPTNGGGQRVRKV